MGKVYNNITPEQVEKFRTEAAANNLDVPPGNEGTIMDGGIWIGFKYDGTSTLTLTILKKGWLPTASQIWGELDKYLTA